MSDLDAAPASLARAPLVVFERLHARDRSGERGAARGEIRGVDAALEPGVHAVLGAPEDGTIALVEALAGAIAPTRGKVTVRGGAPHTSARTRARIGFLSASPRLPPARSVGEAIRLCLRARGEAGERIDAVLDPFGLSSLHARRPASLAYAERRAVELALALTTPAALALALYEPLADVAGIDVALVREAIRDLARAGACVVVATSSPADARTLGDDVGVLVRGALVHGAPVEAGVLAESAELVAWVREADGSAAAVRALASALGGRAEVAGLAWEAPRGGANVAVLRVRGDDLDRCALALAEAAVESNATVEAVTRAAPGLADVQARALAWRAARIPAPLPPRGAA